MANNSGTFFNINDNDGIPLVGVSTDGRVLINHLYGNCLIGSTSVTGTANQNLQVTGGAYVSGNLGVGIANPTTILDVAGDISINSTTAVRRKDYGYSDTYKSIVIGSPSSNVGSVSLGVDVTTITGGNFNGTNQVIIPSNGFLVPNVAGTNFLGVLSRDSSNNLRIGTSAPNGICEGPITVTSSNVGIGTNNPGRTLDVTGVIRTRNYFETAESDGTRNGVISTEKIILGSGSSRNMAFLSDVAGTGFVFYPNGAITEAFRISSTGSVGIGTPNPTSKLHVVGNAIITGITTVGLANTSTPPSNSQMSFELISNTNLRIKVRGTDGVLRSANIALV